MGKENIKVFDSLFSHDPYTCKNCESKYITWENNPSVVNDGDKIFFTELDLHKVKEYVGRDVLKIAWLLESPVIMNQNKIFDYIDDFDIIFTCREDYLEKSPKFRLLPYWCSWIKYDDRLIYPKTKMNSIIASYKRQTDGHRLRHSIISAFNGHFDIFGTGYKPIDDKLDGLRDYKFSIVVENTRQNYYFTEKLLDCFATGTIPIYWGCPAIGDFFNTKGMLSFTDMDELNIIINSLNDNLYTEMLPYIKENFELMKKYNTPEDYLINYKEFQWS